MNRTTALSFAVLVVGCTSKGEVYKTTSVSRMRDLDEALGKVCAQHEAFHHISDGATPQAWRGVEEQRCLPRSDLGGRTWLHVASADNAMPTTKEGTEICRIQIGPDRIAAPLSFEFALALFRDKDTADKVRSDLAGAIPDKELTFLTHRDGISVRIDQFTASDGPYVEIILDGCARLPDSRVNREAGNTLVFPPQGSAANTRP